MARTPKLSVITQYVYDKLNDNAANLGLGGVAYGDQDRIPVNPYVCVEPDNKNADLNGSPRRTMNTFVIYILVYYSAVGSPQDNRAEADILADAIEDLFNSDSHMGDAPTGLVDHCMIASINSGYVKKGNSLMRSSRLTLTAQVQAQLPST